MGVRKPVLKGLLLPTSSRSCPMVSQRDTLKIAQPFMAGEANALKPSPVGTVGRSSRPFGTGDVGPSVFPALKRWAIVDRP